ncbi:MAG: efflux RND transporter permease subunit [Firmicutes bacterium]|nr:efflux RND transporter permease subunit [Bacillota bacterium]
MSSVIFKRIISRPVFVLVIVSVILVLGLVSFLNIPLDLLPEMSFPMAVVYTTYEGAGPHEVENMVTRPLEEALSTLDNLTNISSTSSAGSSMIMISFGWHTDMDFATMDVREQLDLVRGMLPDDVGDPMVFRLNPTMMPVIQIGVSGDLPHDELTTLTEDVIKNRLERLEGVAAVEIGGGLVPEILVEFEPRRLLAYGITIPDLQRALFMENRNFVGGQFKQYGELYHARIAGEFSSLEEIEQLVVGYNQGGPVRLGDVAEVKEAYKEENIISRLNGETTLNISIRKQSDANTVSVASRVHDEMAKLEDELPVRFGIVMDQSEFIIGAIRNLGQMGLVGAFLAAVVLYLFLGNIVLTAIISIAIPVSVIAAFAFLHFQNYTINILTMGGLALGVGMMVDNAIVVLENIFRLHQLGVDVEDAAVRGTSQVAMAITAGTLTTVAVFLPIAFVEGIAGIIFTPLSWTVAFSLLASLLVAVTVIPTLSARWLRRVRRQEREGLIVSFLEKIANYYERLLNLALSHRILTVFVVFGALVLSVFLIPFIGYEFIPAVDSGEVSLSLEIPLGSSLEYTDSIMGEIEDLIIDNPQVETMLSIVGGGSFMGDQEAHTATAVLRLIPHGEREQTTMEFGEDLRRQLTELLPPEVKFTVQDMSSTFMGTGEAPLQIALQGDDLDILAELAAEVANRVRSVEGTREVETSLEQGTPELQVRLDRSRAASTGITTEQIASQIRVALDGQVLTRYRSGAEEIDVRLRTSEETRKDWQALGEMPVPMPTGKGFLPLNQVASIERTVAPQSITREGQVRTVYVSSQLWGRDLGRVAADVEKALSDLSLPLGYSLDMGGEQADMVESFKQLGYALLLAILLVYLVMAAQFESLLHPLVIMFSLPNALIGIVLALVISGYTLNIVSFIGLIILAGIVVNNGIILVDYINQLRREHGYSCREAILEAGKTRLRPVLMTTLTTCLGMLPTALGIGEGAELQAPLAAVVLGGLTSSTLFTLVLVPVIYSLLDELGLRLGWKRKRIIAGKEKELEG